MTTENVDIVVADKVDKNIVNGILAIGAASDKSQKQLDKLQKALNDIGGNSISRLQTQLSSLNSALDTMSATVGRLTSAQNKQLTTQSALAVSQQRLATEIQRTAAAQATAEAATTRAVKAERDLETATVKLATSQQQLVAATARAEAAQLRLAEAQSRSANAANDAANSNNTLMNIIKGAAIGLAVREYIQLADAVTNLSSRLKLVTNSSQELAYVTQSLYKIGQDTRINYIELGKTYAQIARSAKDAGVSQTGLLAVTKTISQAMTISGGSTESMNAALVQLSQGFASGVLRGEELNSVMEQTPRLAQAIAQGLGVSIGKLREMGAAGQLTSEKVLGALAKAAEAVDKEFKNITPTVGQAFTVLTNALTKTVGEFDTASGSSKLLAEAIISVGGAVDGLGNFIKKHDTSFAILAGGIGGTAAAASLYAISAGVGAITTSVGALTVALATNPAVLILLGLGAAAGVGVSIAKAYNDSARGINETIKTLEEANNRSLAALERANGQAAKDNINKVIADRKIQIGELTDKLNNMNGANLKSALRTQELNDANNAAAKIEADRNKGLDLYNKIILKNTGVEDSYIKNMNAIIEMKQAGNLTDKQYNELLASQQKELFKQTGALKESNKAAAEGLSIYKSLTNATKDKVAQLEAELTGTKALTDVEKFVVKTEEDLVQAKGKLSKAQINEIENRVANIQSLDNELKKKKAALAVEAKIAENTEDLAKGLAELNKERDASVKSVYEYSKGISDANDEIKLEKSLFGETEKNRNIAIAQYKIQLDLLKRIDEIKATSPEDRQYQIDQLTNASNLAKQNVVVKESLKEQIDILNSVEKTAHDVFINIFEGGQDAFKKLGNVLKSAVLEMLYQLTVKKWVVNVAANVLGGSTANSLFGNSGSSAISGAGNLLGSSSAGGIMDLLGSSTMGTLDIGGFSLGGLSSAVSGIATALPYIGAAVAAISILGDMFDGGGGPKTEGGFSNATAANFNGKILGTSTGVSAYGGERDAQTKAIVDTVSTQYSTLAKLLGGVAGTVTGASYIASDPQGDALTQFDLGVKLGNKDVYSRNQELGGVENVGRTDEELSAAITLASTKALVSLLQNTEFTPTINEFIRSIDVSKASIEELNAVLADVTAYKSFTDAVNALPFENLKNLSMSAADALVKASGGLETFTANLNGFYENFYTQSEKNAITLQNLTGVFSDLGLSLPTTRDSFKDLVNSQDLTTDAGRKTHAALLAVQAAFASIVPAAEDATTAIDNTATALKALQDKTDAAYQALVKSVNNELEIANKSKSAKETFIASIKSVIEVLKTNISGLLDQQSATVGMTGAAGSNFIQNALNSVLAGGALPDSNELSNAVTAARAGIEGNINSSELDKERDRIVLSNKLDLLRGYAGSQLTQAEEQLQAIESQIDSLNNILTVAKQQLDAVRGVDSSIQNLTVALNNFANAINSEISGIKTAADIANSVTNTPTNPSNGRPIFSIGGSEINNSRPLFSIGGSEVNSYDVGTRSISYDQIAQVHAGEEITPAKYVNANKEASIVAIEMVARIMADMLISNKDTAKFTEETSKRLMSVIDGSKTINTTETVKP